MSPFENPDLSAVNKVLEAQEPNILLGAKAQEIKDEMDDGAALPLFRKQIARLAPPIRAASREAEDEAWEKIRSRFDYQQTLRSFKEYRLCEIDHTSALKRVAGAVEMSAVGRAGATKKAGAERDAEAKRCVGVASNCTDALLSTFKQTPPAPPTVVEAAEIQVIFSSFEHLTARMFLAEAISALHEAILGSDRFNALVLRSYGPLVQRRAASPEKWSRILQPAYQSLSALMAEHIAVLLQTAQHRLVVEFTARVESHFTFLVNSCKQHHGWPEADILQISWPELWSEISGTEKDPAPKPKEFVVPAQYSWQSQLKS